MAITKSKGVTATEELLATLCEQSFLKLWSYPNPFKDDQDELCDLLAVFENHIFIFFDRENLSLYKENKDPQVNWNRWKRKAIDAQTRTAHGAERYIRSGREIFLDNEQKVPFPIPIDHEQMIVHKIIIAHGAEEACLKASDKNVYGSLGISYGLNIDLPVQFMIDIEKENPVHVFDSHNLPIIFSELNTFFDFSSYLDAKAEAIRTYKGLVYCGEEDLLAHYLLNFNETTNKHFIGALEDDVDMIMIGEGEWKDFIELDIYINKKKEDEASYFWDEIIQRTCQNTLDGTILGESTPLNGRSAIHEMAKEPRFHRRALSQQMIRSIQNFPDVPQAIMRNLSYMPSFFDKKGYVFLQLKIDDIKDYENDYRPKRIAMLEIACGSAKNKFPHLETVIGIAIDAPKYSKTNCEDFILMDCCDWPDKTKAHYEKANGGFNFFNSKGLTVQRRTVTEFPPINTSKQGANQSKIKRNSPCPCGSGKKYKKCCRNTLMA